MSHAATMDRIYRWQRGIYDLTRKYFLLGRDRLLARMDPPEGAAVLEVGCGTARNLIHLARRRPDLDLYGLDASSEMLRTAGTKLARAGLDVPLRVCLAEQLDHRATFGRDTPFDAILFSYALSMIPSWRDALEAALANLAPGGSVYIVDFCDQADLPAWFRRILVTWLGWFHVRHEPALLAYLHELDAAGRVMLRLEPLYGRYAYLARLASAEPSLRHAPPVACDADGVSEAGAHAVCVSGR